MSTTDSPEISVSATADQPAASATKKPIPLTHPFVIFLLQLISLGTIGYILLNQKVKAIASLIYSLVFGLLGVGWIFVVLGALDASLLARRKENGEELEPHDCEIHFLHFLPIYAGF